MGKEKPHILRELEGSIESYLADLRSFMREHGVVDLLRGSVDHVAFKAADYAHYSAIVGGIVSKSRLSSFTRMDGRQIATIELVAPISLGELGETYFLEIMEPKPEKVGRDLVGFEHIEIYNPDFEGIMRALRESGVNFEDGGNDYHKTIVLKINEKGQEVKFTNGRLGEIVKRQTKDGISVLIKSSGDVER